MPVALDLFTDYDSPRAARFLTERELVRVLGLSRTTLWRLRKEGLPTLTVGRNVRYDIEKVRNWLASGIGSQISARETIDSKKNLLAECHWSLSVAFDPKHRPQEPNRPAS